MTTSIFDFPVTGVYSGLQLVNQLNTAFASLITNNAGTTPPTNPVLNQLWYDTTTGTLFIYNGTTWVQTAFGAPFVGVQIVSGGITVTPDQFGAIIEAQGQSTYSVTLPNPSDYVGVNTAVFSNINTSSPVSVATAAGSILGTGSNGSSMLLPYGSLGLFVSDGYNWLAFSNAGYALLGGASTQTFDVATAASAANAIPLAQAQTTFAGVNGNSSEVFAAANASAAQDVVNLGQAENLFPQLSGDNTFTGDQTIQGTIAVPANAGEITGGSMPSGAAAAWVQAAFSSAYAGLIQNYYLNGAQVYSLSSAGDIVAHSAALTSGSIGSLTVTGAATVPDATASGNPVTLGQTTDGSLSPTFDNITTGTQTTTGNQTVNGELVVSGATNAQSATFTSLSAGSGAFTALQSNNITGIFSGSLGSSSFNTLLGGTISAATISAGTIITGGQHSSDYALSGLITIEVGAPTSPAVTTKTTGGTLAASTAYEYQLAAVYPWGESAPTGAVGVTTGATATNENTITWADAPGSTDTNIYGRVAGSIALIATVAAGVTSYVDTGSVAPSGALPTGDMTLDEAQVNAAILSFEGAMVENVKITLPLNPQLWVVNNDTTEAFALSFTTAAATLAPVGLQQGSSEVLYVQPDGVVAASSAGGGGATGAIIVQVGTGVTLTPTQAANSAIIRIQGAMTANAQVTFPTSLEQIWEVSNETTGAYTLSALVAGSTAAALTLGQGDSQSVWSDGATLRMTTGATGPAGAAATVQVGTVTTGAAGSSAEVSNSGTEAAAVLDFTIPQGDVGDTGVQGPSGTLAVGTVTTGAAGSSVVVTNSGTSSAAVLNFTIPQGEKGAAGDIGTAGSTIQQPILVGEVETQVTNTASGTAATLDQASGTAQVLTLTGNCTLTFSPSTGASGVLAAMTIILTQDSTGSRTVTWPTGTIFTAGSAPTLSTTAGQSDLFVAFLLAGSSTWVVTVIAQGVTL